MVYSQNTASVSLMKNKRWHAGWYDFSAQTKLIHGQLFFNGFQTIVYINNDYTITCFFIPYLLVFGQTSMIPLDRVLSVSSIS